MIYWKCPHGIATLLLLPVIFDRIESPRWLSLRPQAEQPIDTRGSLAAWLVSPWTCGVLLRTNYAAVDLYANDAITQLESAHRHLRCVFIDTLKSPLL